MKKIVSLFSIILLSLTLVACGNSTKDSQSSSSSKSTSSKIVASSKHSSSKKTSSSSSAKSASSSSSSVAVQAQSVSAPSGTNLSSAQVDDWVWQNFSQTTNNYRTDYLLNPYLSDGEVHVAVKENHQSQHMQSMGADPNTEPTIGYYKVDSAGHLSVLNMNDNTWSVVSSAYPG